MGQKIPALHAISVLWQIPSGSPSEDHFLDWGSAFSPQPLETSYSHTHPDADGIGSALLLALSLLSREVHRREELSRSFSQPHRWTSEELALLELGSLYAPELGLVWGPDA